MTLLKTSIFSSLIVLILMVGACKNEAPKTETEKPNVSTDVRTVTVPQSNVLTLYTDCKIAAKTAPFLQFTQSKGIKVNIITGTSEELVEQLVKDGSKSIADVILLTDAKGLYQAKSKQLLKPFISIIINKNVPAGIRDHDNQWFGLSKRARGIAYAKARVKPSELSSYNDLTKAKWRGRLLVGPAANIDQQCLLAGLIARDGKKETTDWAAGIVTNMARPPKGSDIDQLRALASGSGDLALVNTNALAELQQSKVAADRKAAEGIGFFFPKTSSGFPHTNVSGIGILNTTPHLGNAIQFIEYMTSEPAQRAFAVARYDYPVHPNAPSIPALNAIGPFTPDDLFLDLLGHHNSPAKKIFKEVGWK